jgi:hypothetical protein
MTIIRSLVASCLVVAAGVGLATSGIGQGNPQKEPQRRPGVDRTTKLLQSMTPQQRKIASLFTKYGTNTKVLDDQLSIMSHDDDGVGTGTKETTTEILTRLKCSDSSAFVATVQQTRTFPIEDGTFLFTEYHVLIDEAIRLDPRTQNRFSRNALLVRPGGHMVVDGFPVSTERASFPQLQNWRQYLIFASYLPEVDAFHTANGKSVFLLSEGKGRALKDMQAAERNLQDGMDAKELLTAVRGIQCR